MKKAQHHLDSIAKFKITVCRSQNARHRSLSALGPARSADGNCVACFSVSSRLCGVFQCLDGRLYTRTEIGEPTGTALTSLYKISTSHRDYRPPVGLRQKYPSAEGYREPWNTVLCVSRRLQGRLAGLVQSF